MPSANATVRLKVWKPQICQVCGTNFQYQLERSAHASSRESPADAERRAVAALTLKLQHDVDPHPCPSCGRYQREMIAALQAHVYAIWVELASVALVGAATLGLTNMLPRAVCVWISSAIALYLLALHFKIATARPNADLTANKLIASKEIESGLLRVLPVGAEAPQVHAPGGVDSPGLTSWLLVVIACAALLAVGSSEAMRVARTWPSSWDLYPPVVGPGDTTVVYMPESISSLCGYWRGTPTVRATGIAEADWCAATNQSDWGDRIYVGNGQGTESHRPWVQLTVPDRDDLAGRRVHLEVDLETVRPVAASLSREFYMDARKLSRTVDMTLAPRGAGSMYERLWLSGVVGGGAAAIVVAFMGRGIARSRRRLSTGSRVYPLDAAAS